MVTIHDVTLRDGNHACEHSISPELVTFYVKRAADAGVDEIEVGHGNGLGASTLQVGKSKHNDYEVIHAANAVKGSMKLCVLAIPGWATLNHIDLATDMGVDIVRVGCHCTEADTTKRYIEHVVSKGKEAHGVLMMSHRIPPEQLWIESGKMMAYGASRTIIMDSAGYFTPYDIRDRLPGNFRYASMMGFHAHNNLGLAVANSLVAAQCHASIIDCSARGFGAGAGNAPLELVAAAFHRAGIPTNLRMNKVLDLAKAMENEIDKMDSCIPYITSSSILSGMAGVFSGFRKQVVVAAATYNVPEDRIWFELGRRGVVAGQEDMVIDVAQELSKR